MGLPTSGNTLQTLSCTVSMGESQGVEFYLNEARTERRRRSLTVPPHLLALSVASALSLQALVCKGGCLVDMINTCMQQALRGKHTEPF